jgi:3-methylcrotonyl-CoA carboxylase alpha subunit
MITGHDLVEWQIRIAAGAALPATQAQISFRGHAMEARLYAEDPGRDFAPASGSVRTLRLPGAAADLRIETGMREGDEVSIYYDALIAKLVAFGAAREEARRRLETALAQVEIAGIANNRDFLVRLVRHPDVVAGAIDTGLIERQRAALTLPLSAAPLAALAAASLAWLNGAAGHGAADDLTDAHSPWRLRDGWRLAGETDCALSWSDAGMERKVNVRFGRAGLTLATDDTTVAVRLLGWDGKRILLECGSARIEAQVERQDDELCVGIDQRRWTLRFLDPLARPPGAQIDPARLVAPVHGRVLDVLVSPGASVTRGQALILLECMKLEYRVTAPVDGVVAALHYAAGDVVEEGAQLLTFVPGTW